MRLPIVLLAALLLASGAARADRWYFTGGSPGERLYNYVNLETVRTLGKTVRTYAVAAVRLTERPDERRPRLVVARKAVDCARFASRTMRAAGFFADGDVESSVTEKAEWIHPLPGSAAETEARSVCTGTVPVGPDGRHVEARDAFDLYALADARYRGSGSRTAMGGNELRAAGSKLFPDDIPCDGHGIPLAPIFPEDEFALEAGGPATGAPAKAVDSVHALEPNPREAVRALRELNDRAAETLMRANERTPLKLVGPDADAPRS